MRYLDFLFGEQVTFTVSPKASPKQVSERLRAEVRSRLWPFHFEKIVGQVGDEKMSIEWRGSPFGSNMFPRLKGRLVSSGTATQFIGKFGAPTFLRFFLGVWVCFDAMFVVFAATGNLEGGNTSPLFIWPFLAAHVSTPFAISALGMIGADKVRNRLINFVIEVGSGRANPNV
jgi:hypothetical protein